MKYKEIRKYQTTSLMTEFLICPYCQIFSPFFTKYFLKNNIIPNIATVYMIISGIIGAVLFAIPTVFTQILGAIFIHIWFIIDCSDGEVARITQRFSTFGKEIDYTAHVINHPLFNLGILSAMYFSGNYNMIWVFIGIFLLSILDTISRHLCSFYDIQNLKIPNKQSEESGNIYPKSVQIKTFILNSLLFYPNFVLLFPIFFFIDMGCGTTLAFWLIIIYVLINLLFIPKQMYGWVKTIVKA
ncbi:MAG: CDP-alcohol phosphatidyltransferase family protein [Clostridiales bacterium]